VSFSTFCVTQSSIFISMTITERSALLTTSFTSIFSASKCSFPCCSYVFSSSNFAWREIFSCSIARNYSKLTPCTCVKAWVACSISSYAHRRRASTVSASRWSWAGSSPNSGFPDGRGIVETMWMD
jgi:hypothetical protein